MVGIFLYSVYRLCLFRWLLFDTFNTTHRYSHLLGGTWVFNLFLSVEFYFSF